MVRAVVTWVSAEGTAILSPHMILNQMPHCLVSSINNAFLCRSEFRTVR
jgi:hypothetical protein